jgi:hypothetical protein
VDLHKYACATIGAQSRTRQYLYALINGSKMLNFVSRETTIFGIMRGRKSRMLLGAMDLSMQMDAGFI